MYRVVIHLENDTFKKVLFPDMIRVATYLGQNIMGLETSPYVVSVAVFKGEKMIQFHTPIRDPELIEKGGEQLRGPHFPTR